MTTTHYIIVLAALQVADLLTTWYALHKGYGKEVNPVLIKLAEFTKLFTNAKWAWLVIAKVVGAAVSVYVAYGSELASILLLIFYVVVIANNLIVLNKQGH
jgi:hypothetical protein